MKKMVVVLGAVVAALAIGAPSASAQAPTTCEGTLTGVVHGDVVVPFGQQCEIKNAFVTGNVSTDSRARLVRIERSIVLGDAGCFDCSRFELDTSSIGGDLDLTEVSGGVSVCRSVVAGEGRVFGVSTGVDVGNQSLNCGGSVFAKSLDISLSFGPVTAERNVIAKNLVLNQNFAGVTLNRNLAGANLECTDNDPEPTGSQNVAAAELGQCADL